MPMAVPFGPSEKPPLLAAKNHAGAAALTTQQADESGGLGSRSW